MVAEVWRMLNTRCRQHLSWDSKILRTRCHQCLLNCCLSENLDQWILAQRLDTVADHHSSRKNGNTRLCQNCRMISLISHPSRVMLWLILNRLVGQAEQILEIAEEYHWTNIQPRGVGRKIFRIPERPLLFHNFIDFKKAYYRVWQDSLWRVLKEYNIDGCTMKQPALCYQMEVSEISFKQYEYLTLKMSVISSTI